VAVWWLIEREMVPWGGAAGCDVQATQMEDARATLTEKFVHARFSNRADWVAE